MLPDLTRTLFGFPFEHSEDAFSKSSKDVEFFKQKKSIHSVVKVRNRFHPSEAHHCSLKTNVSGTGPCLPRRYHQSLSVDTVGYQGLGEVPPKSMS